jgi:hypothetical protein
MATNAAKGKETEAASDAQQNPATIEATSQGIPVTSKSAEMSPDDVEDKGPENSKYSKSDALNARTGQDPLYSNAKTNADVRSTSITSSPWTNQVDGIVGDRVARCKGKVREEGRDSDEGVQ